MANGDNKRELSELRSKVRLVLMNEWDPIGIKDVPQAQDEYHTYGDRVCVMLMDALASKRAIAAYLYDVVINRMGFSASAAAFENCANVADSIIALRPGFETH